MNSISKYDIENNIPNYKTLKNHRENTGNNIKQIKEEISNLNSSSSQERQRLYSLKDERDYYLKLVDNFSLKNIEEELRYSLLLNIGKSMSY